VVAEELERLSLAFNWNSSSQSGEGLATLADMPLKEKPVGKLISFEGSEGSGKSTQIAALAAHLAEQGYEVITVREPGGTELGEQIRNIIVHNSKGDEMCPETELLLFAAARAQLVREVIAPALMRGCVVLSDRFLDSSTVYQGVARNLALGPVNHINHFAVGNVMPDLTIVLDVPTELSLQRIRQRASDLPDRMERENIDFYNKVREGYLILGKEMPERVVVINGAAKEATVKKNIWDLVKARIKGAANTPAKNGRKH
jgi:dTMP kinase